MTMGSDPTPASAFGALGKVVEVQIAATPAPDESTVIAWARAALAGDERGLCIRVVDEGESEALNARYRGQPRATNVLSFPADVPELLGDIAICGALVEREACEQNKSLEEGFAHMVVHGVLHLKGMDHEDEGQAQEMEARETEILESLGFSDPYLSR